MAWIEYHQTMPRHKKTLRLSRELSISRREAIGLMCDLWCWGLDNANADGLLANVTREDIAAALDYPLSEADTLLKALICSGYLEETELGYILHDWHDYAGKLTAKREANKKRMKEKRATHVQNTCDARAGATVHNSTVYIYPPISPQGESVSERFTRFWTEYPKKVWKVAAEKAFAKIAPDEELLQVMLDAVAAAKETENWTKDGGKYIPYPSTWLNQRRWEDELPKAIEGPIIPLYRKGDVL